MNSRKEGVLSSLNTIRKFVTVVYCMVHEFRSGNSLPFKYSSDLNYQHEIHVAYFPVQQL